MHKQILYINTSSDKNIFHVFMMELLEIWRLVNKNSNFDHMLLTDFEHLPSDIWRIYILSHLVKNLYSSRPSTAYHPLIKTFPREATLYTPEILKIHFKWFECWNPTNYGPNQELINFTKWLKVKMNVFCTTNKITFVNRKNSRKVFDKITNKPIEEILMLYGIECCYFEDKTPQEQIDFVKDSKIMIMAHGSGLTNMIFTHENCEIIEISNRKYWYCDPLCDKHRTKQLSLNESCGTKSPYPNYDYINMCKLLNKHHHEISNVEYTQDENCIRPMDRNILVDSSDLIRSVFQIVKQQNFQVR